MITWANDVSYSLITLFAKVIVIRMQHLSGQRRYHLEAHPNKMEN